VTLKLTNFENWVRRQLRVYSVELKVAGFAFLVALVIDLVSSPSSISQISGSRGRLNGIYAFR
jgi:hypothetical protein